MTEQLRQKLAKVYELVKRGATEGEREAAKMALDKMLDKYNVDEFELAGINKTRHAFKYTSQLEIQLFSRLLATMISDSEARSTLYRDLRKGKELSLELTYLDYITMQAAYEYFRRHMKAQWVKLCAAELKRKRKPKTRNARREQLQDLFFTQYAIASKLIEEKHLMSVSWSDMSEQEKKDYMSLEDIEGGAYNRQMTSGLLLGN